MARSDSMMNLSLRALLPLTAALTLAGCINLAPADERPALPIPAQLPSATGTAAAAGADAVRQPAWRDLVRDERLRQVVDRALLANRDLKVAVLNVERSRAQWQISDADRWPTLNAAVSANRAPNTSGKQANTLQAGLQVSSFELDLFGRVRNSGEAAQASFLATEAAARSARLALVTQTIASWLTLAADEEQLRLARETLDSREQTYKLTALRAQVGAASDLELRAAQTLTAQAQATLAQLQRQRTQDRNALTVLVGDALPSELFPSPADGAQAGWLAEVPAGARSDVLLLRPDVIQAEQTLRAANASIGAARAAIFPRIALSGSVGQVSDSLNGLVNAGTTAWTLGASAAMALFDAGRNSANVKVAEVSREIALAQYEKTLQTAFQEAANGLEGQSEWRKQVSAQNALLQAESERARLTRLKLQAGAVSLSDVLEVERSLASAQQAAVQTRLGELLNRLSLYKALGGEQPADQTVAAAPAQ
ncbi:efflux transporter outer membrane subunit [Ideonella sp.]|uniref:efflux transporter outer membrane subunit n=1 Tax=Ideonella sp. TaxID=1929293 RepID=UPI003BB6EBCB